MRVVVVWAALLAALALMLTLWWQDALANAIFWAAAGGALVVALVAVRPRDRARVLPDSSLGIVVLAVGISGLVAGNAFGDWHLYLGVGLTALGAALVLREVVLERRR